MNAPPPFELLSLSPFHVDCGKYSSTFARTFPAVTHSKSSFHDLVGSVSITVILVGHCGKVGVALKGPVLFLDLPGNYMFAWKSFICLHQLVFCHSMESISLCYVSITMNLI